MYKGVALSPLLWAVQCYSNDLQDSSIIGALLDRNADVQYAETTTGLNPLMMCCHLTNEQDAHYLATLLLEHSSQLPEAQQLDLDAQDKQGNTALHHAVMTKKTNLVKYLVEQQPDFGVKNNAQLLAVDLAPSKELIFVLQKHQKRQDLKKLPKKKANLFGTTSAKNRQSAKPPKGPALEFKNKHALRQQERAKQIQEAKAAGGRYLLQVGDANETAASEKMQLQDFKAINRLAGSTNADVYLACPKKHGKTMAKEPLFAVKVVDKSKASHRARYDLDNKKTVGAVMYHPNLLNIDYMYMNEQKFFICTQYCHGGDLGSIIKQMNLKALGSISEDDTRTYATEIVTAIGHLHAQNFVHGSITPDSILIKGDGHVKLAYDCLENGFTDDGKETIGNYAYTAPEMIDSQPATKSTDWYLLGLVLYEMLVGSPPFLAAIRSEMYDNILYGELEFPDEVSDDAADLICKLLEKDPTMRLGGLTGIDEIKGHPFFNGVKWSLADLQKQKMPSLRADSQVQIKPAEKAAFEKLCKAGAVSRTAQKDQESVQSATMPKNAPLEDPKHW